MAVPGGHRSPAQLLTASGSTHRDTDTSWAWGGGGKALIPPKSATCQTTVPGNGVIPLLLVSASAHPVQRTLAMCVWGSLTAHLTACCSLRTLQLSGLNESSFSTWNERGTAPALCGNTNGCVLTSSSPTPPHRRDVCAITQTGMSASCPGGASETRPEGTLEVPVGTLTFEPVALLITGLGLAPSPCHGLGRSH